MLYRRILPINDFARTVTKVAGIFLLRRIVVSADRKVMQVRLQRRLLVVVINFAVIQAQFPYCQIKNIRVAAGALLFRFRQIVLAGFVHGHTHNRMVHNDVAHVLFAIQQ